MRRLCVAMCRLMQADSDLQRICATRWVNAWAGAIGELHFSGFVEGRFGHKRKR